jgi:hypothetical protein
VRISRKEAFSFGLARKLLAHYEGTPLHLDMRSVLDKIAESLEEVLTKPGSGHIQCQAHRLYAVQLCVRLYEPIYLSGVREKMPMAFFRISRC